ncbi:MAG: tyrosine-type recombinase/integrase [Candidatus Latescibacterota bacterium]|nr:MAG: tyrosine-type recombinase/integrase [Candidatus Latescibacterota bacterium]
MPHFLVEGLRRHRIQQTRERLRLGPLFLDHRLVCPRPDGSPWNPDHLSSEFSKFIRRQDLPRIRFHDLRHTHATLMLRVNEHPKIVSERLGHSNVSITLDTYSHVLPTMQREAADKIDDLLGEKD